MGPEVHVDEIISPRGNAWSGEMENAFILVKTGGTVRWFCAGNWAWGPGKTGPQLTQRLGWEQHVRNGRDGHSEPEEGWIPSLPH
jgi:hypothetical protein